MSAGDNVISTTVEYLVSFVLIDWIVDFMM